MDTSDDLSTGKKAEYMMNLRDKIPNNTKYVHSILKPFLSRNVLDTDIVSELKSGTRISIFWKGDMVWYNGTIQKVEDGNEFHINYDDGEIEVISNLEISNSYKWRTLRHNKFEPHYSLEIFNEYSNSFKDCMKKSCSKTIKRDYVVFSGISDIFSEDFRTLEPNTWLTEVIIEEFLKTLLRISLNSTDERILLISSQIYKLYEDMELETFQMKNTGGNRKTERVSRWVKNLELHDIDFIIAPLNISNQHWCLTISSVEDLKVSIIDPFEPSNINKIPQVTRNLVIRYLNDTWNPYFSKYGLERRWSLVQLNQISSDLNFPSQPHENGTDCGVLVSLYAWSFLVGEPIPKGFFPSTSAGQHLFFLKMRELMGRTICSTIS